MDGAGQGSDGGAPAGPSADSAGPGGNSDPSAPDGSAPPADGGPVTPNTGDVPPGQMAPDAFPDVGPAATDDPLAAADASAPGGGDAMTTDAPDSGAFTTDAPDAGALPTGAPGDVTTDPLADPSAEDSVPDASGAPLSPVPRRPRRNATSPEVTPAAAADSGGSDSACFPADATVELQDGSVVRIDAVAIGDMVKVGAGEFSRVFMFTHKMADSANTFVALETASGASLSLTKGHYIYADGALVAASEVTVGSELTLGNGQVSAVVAVGSTGGVGLFNPQTVNGNIVVNGVLASTYTTAVEPSVAHAILAPFRLLNSFGFQFTALESGGGALDAVAPRGQAVL
jgi:hypothetical protein